MSQLPTPDASVELRLSAVPTNVVVARQALSGVADAVGWDPVFTDDVRLALSEACTNVVRHAYRHAASPGDMLVSILLEAGQLVVAVVDQGVGIDPDRESPGLGLGLPLMRTLADDMHLTTTPGHTEVRMSFLGPVLTAAGE